ncbi:MAG: hypothetical protein PSY14_06740 [bacterium]|nr:hypothetical protein [bacterium]
MSAIPATPPAAGAPPAATPAAGTQAAAPATPPAATPAPGTQPAAAPAAGGYRPEGLADHYYGKDDKETIEKLHNAVTGFRKENGKKGIPETAEAYTLTLPDDIKDKVLRPDAGGKDPVLEVLKPIFHKHGVSQSAFNDIVAEVYKGVAAMGEGGGEGQGPSIDLEFKSMGGAEAAKPLQDGANAWINGLKATGKLDDKAVQELTLLTSFGEGLHTINQLRTLSGEKPIPPKLDGAQSTKPTVADYEARVADDRYWKQGVKDEAFIEETRAMARIVFAA